MNLFGKRFDQLKTTSPSSISNSTQQMASNHKKSTPIQTSPMQSQSTSPNEQCMVNNGNSDINQKSTDDNVEISVDDHFAKALGDTWKQLQQNRQTNSSTGQISDTESIDENIDKKSTNNEQQIANENIQLKNEQTKISSDMKSQMLQKSKILDRKKYLKKVRRETYKITLKKFKKM